ncbi:MAG: metal-sulfur cluster assembly factor [Desulfomonilaceae bacterium]
MEAERVETRVKQALAEIIDPEISLSIIRMDLIHDLAVATDGSVSLIFRPSSPICPMAYSLANSIKKRLETVKGTTSINIRVENFERAAHLESLLQSTETSDQRKVD